MAFSLIFASAQNENVKLFTIFTSYGCGCTGSGGAPDTYTTQEEVLDELRQACNEIDFIEFEGTSAAAYKEVITNKDSYDGVLVIGRLAGDYRLAFTSLPTIVVNNLFKFMDAQPYHLFETGKIDHKSILKGGTDYHKPRILTAQLDRRNLSSPAVRESMFNDLVYKINLIQAIKKLQETGPATLIGLDIVETDR